MSLRYCAVNPSDLSDCQRDDERVEVRVAHEHTVDEADRGRQPEGDDDRLQELVVLARTDAEQNGSHHRDHRRDRQVDAPGHDDEHLAERSDGEDARKRPDLRERGVRDRVRGEGAATTKSDVDPDRENPAAPGARRRVGPEANRIDEVATTGHRHDAPSSLAAAAPDSASGIRGGADGGQCGRSAVHRLQDVLGNERRCRGGAGNRRVAVALGDLPHLRRDDDVGWYGLAVQSHHSRRQGDPRVKASARREVDLEIGIGDVGPFAEQSHFIGPQGEHEVERHTGGLVARMPPRKPSAYS